MRRCTRGSPGDLPGLVELVDVTILASVETRVLTIDQANSDRCCAHRNPPSAEFEPAIERFDAPMTCLVLFSLRAVLSL